jgi:hypothetical protein
MRPEKKRELLKRAESGDWEAARELASFRVYGIGLYDATTLKLVRIWADHDHRGLIPLQRVLFESCDLSDRREAIQKLQRLIEHPWFSSQAAGVREYFQTLLSSLKARVLDKPSPCAILR